jgi:hypothetical protein
MTLLTVDAIGRSGSWGRARAPASVIRIAAMVWLAVLALRGVGWARRALILALSLSAIISVLGYPISIDAYAVGIMEHFAAATLYIWAVVELSLADLAARQ